MKALLALEDGFVLEGESFTGPIELTGGEVIFNTAMAGYQELLTDPSKADDLANELLAGSFLQRANLWLMFIA